MSQRFARTLTATCLALALVVLAIWGFSYFRAVTLYATIDKTHHSPTAGRPVSAGEVTLGVVRGRMMVGALRLPDSGLPLPLTDFDRELSPPDEVSSAVNFSGRGWRYGGFDFHWLPFGAYGSVISDVAIPLWAIVVVLLIYPLLYVRRRRLASCPGFDVELETAGDDRSSNAPGPE